MMGRAQSAKSRGRENAVSEKRSQQLKKKRGFRENISAAKSTKIFELWDYWLSVLLLLLQAGTTTIIVIILLIKLLLLFSTDY
jgi:hypothetical protein